MSEEPAERQPKLRAVAEILAARPTIEGAGVHLRRAFGAAEVPRLDPFLLLDDFRSENPAEYIAGFPWHPHRGIETVTYMLDGRVEHEDSIGNKGIIGRGDVQWMSAGSGATRPSRTCWKVAQVSTRKPTTSSRTGTWSSSTMATRSG